MADTNRGRPRTPRKASTPTRSFDAVAAVHQQGPSVDVDSVRLEVRSYGLCRWVKDSFRVGAIEMMPFGRGLQSPRAVVPGGRSGRSESGSR
jgi:hypothetical protein